MLQAEGVSGELDRAKLDQGCGRRAQTLLIGPGLRAEPEKPVRAPGERARVNLEDFREIWCAIDCPAG